MFFLQANTTSLINVADLQLIAPELILTACACMALVMEVILPYRKSKLTAYFSLVGIALAFISLGLQWWYMGPSLPYNGFYGMVRIDGFALLFKAIFLCGSAGDRYFHSLSRHRRRTTWRVLRSPSISPLSA